MSGTTQVRERASGAPEVKVVGEADLQAEVVQAPPKKRKLVLVVVAVAALALIGFGANKWWFGRSHVTTDNAQVEGHITPVLARVGGYVTEVRVSDNQKVPDDCTSNRSFRKTIGTASSVSFNPRPMPMKVKSGRCSTSHARCSGFTSCKPATSAWSPINFATASLR